MSAPESSVSFDRAAEYYDATRAFAIGHEAAAVRQFIDAGTMTADSRVLEIGVGTGRVAIPLSRQTGGFYAGIDISGAMLSKLHAKPGGDHISTVLGDATTLPFPNARFDAIIAVHIFHLIPNYTSALAECARVLKSGGLLLHGWGQRIQLPELEAIWDQYAGEPLNRKGNWYAQDDTSPFLGDAGWIATGPIHRYTYKDGRSPAMMLEGIEGGYWSNLWHMPRERINAGVAALRAYIDAHYADPSVPVVMDQVFRVQAYRPPE